MIEFPSEIEEQIKDLDELINGPSDKHKLILWNDDVNTFEHVIQSLIEICKHSPEQAEQCALLVHTKGKCDVKSGGFDYLRPMAEALIDRGINATID